MAASLAFLSLEERKSEIGVDNSHKCAKIYQDIVTQYEKEAAVPPTSERGQWEPLGQVSCGPLSCGLRDQDGRSRYRAIKMLSLQRSRVVPRDHRPCA